MKSILKKFSKSNLGDIILSQLLYVYIKILHITCKVKISPNSSLGDSELCNLKKTTLALWHQDIILALFMHKFNIPNLKAVISLHSDARILASIMHKLSYDIIDGSSNKGAFRAFLNISKTLRGSGNIVITPDGPRGPAKEVNSNINQICKKEGANLIAVSFFCSNLKFLNSWDMLKIPMPFSKIIINFSAKITLTGDITCDSATLKQILN
jgi:Kdo2-lipid IVA 3' secondary acyltransferase